MRRITIRWEHIKTGKQGSLSFSSFDEDDFSMVKDLATAISASSKFESVRVTEEIEQELEFWSVKK